jgi:hypothetical protein
MNANAPDLDFPALWAEAEPYDAFIAASQDKHKGLWEAIHRLAVIPDWAHIALPEGSLHLLVIAEDWCGDAANSVPLLARWAEATPGADLRVLRRDRYPAVMDRYLTNGSRSIPIVIALDRELRELGHWGPRPTELQAWVMANRLTMPKSELYPQVRRWYARDRGVTTLTEVFAAAGIQRKSAA